MNRKSTAVLVCLALAFLLRPCTAGAEPALRLTSLRSA